MTANHKNETPIPLLLIPWQHVKPAVAQQLKCYQAAIPNKAMIPKRAESGGSSDLTASEKMKARDLFGVIARGVPSLRPWLNAHQEILDFVLKSRNDACETPLLYATSSRKFSAAMELVEYGSNVNDCNATLQSAAHLAAANGQSILLRALMGVFSMLTLTPLLTL